MMLLCTLVEHEAPHRTWIVSRPHRVVILGVGEVMKGAASLRSLKESYVDSFEYDVQQRPWYVRHILLLGAKLGARTIEAQSQPPTYKAFPWTVYGFCLLIVGFLLQLLAALCGVTRMPK
jgi:hypothetical protein